AADCPARRTRRPTRWTVRPVRDHCALGFPRHRPCSLHRNHGHANGTPHAMSYLLVPHAVSDRSADVWFAAIDEAPRPLVVAWPTGTRELRAPDWTEWEFGGRKLRYGTILLPGLASRTPYALQLRAGDSVVARANLTTLPTRLPGVGERPFTVL